MSCNLDIVTELKRQRDEIDKKIEGEMTPGQKAKQVADEKLQKVKDELRTRWASEAEKDLDKIIESNKGKGKVALQEEFNDYYSKQKLYAIEDLNNEISRIKTEAELARVAELPHLGGPREVLDFVTSRAEKEISSSRRTYDAMLLNGLRDADVIAYATEKENQKLIMRELQQLREGGKKGITGDASAMKAAEVFRKFYNRIHNDLTAKGIPLGYVEGYMGPRNWNPTIIGQADLLEFTKDFKTGLDRTQYPSHWTEKEFDEMLEGFYDKFSKKGNPEFQVLPESMKSKKTTLERMVEERSLYLLPEKEIDLLEKYGDTNLMKNSSGYAYQMAKRSALVTNFGPMPAQGFDNFANIVRRKAPKGAEEKFNSEIRKSKSFFDQLTNPKRFGSGDSVIAKFGETSRAVVASVSLKPTSAMQAAFTDPVMYAGHALAQYGDNLFSGIGSYLNMTFKTLSDRQGAAALIGNVMEITQRENLERIGFYTEKKGFAKYINTLNKMTMMPFQQGISQAGARFAGSARLIEALSGKMGANMEYAFKVHGIDNDVVEVFKKHIADFHGSKVLNEVSLAEDMSITPRLRQKAIQASNRFLNDAERGIVVAGAKQASVWNQMDVDSVGGQVWRSLGMFKSYPLAALNAMGDHLHFNPTGKIETVNGFRRFRGNYGNAAQVILSTAAASYMTIVAREHLIKGRTAPKMDIGLLARVLGESGAMGLYADYIFTDYEKYGGVTLQSKLVGPVLGKYADITEITQQMVLDAANPKKSVDATKAFNLLVNSIPIANYPLIKPALDHVLFEGLRDMHESGWRARERQKMKDQGQSPLRVMDSLNIPHFGR